MQSIKFIRGTRLLIHESYHDLLKNHGLNNFDNLYSLAGGELFKQNRFRSVVRVYLTDEKGQSHIFHLKRHHPPFLTRLKSILTGFRIHDGAENEWSKILRLESIGIHTMTPVAYGAVRKWGLPFRALTLTEHLYGAERLEDYFPALFGAGLSVPGVIAYKRKIISGTAQWARKFHRSGFYHQDFYLGHIFIKPGEGEDFSLHLIDLQRVRERKRLRKSMVVKDLSQLNFSATQLSCLSRADRLRFLKSYLNKARLGPAEKDLIRRIEEKTQRIALHTRKFLARRARKKGIRPGNTRSETKRTIGERR